MRFTLPLIALLLMVHAPLSAQPATPTWHVSPATGNDANDGSALAPLATLREAMRRVRDGHQVLLRRGEVFTGPVGEWTASGASDEQPAILGAYGQGPDPVIHCGDQTGMQARGSVSHVVVRGLTFIAQSRLPAYPGFNPHSVTADPHGLLWRAPGQGILIEDCSFIGFKNNLTFDAPPDQRIQGVTLRRVRVLDAYASLKSQGAFFSRVDQLLIEDCTFDHNGWHPTLGGGRNKFNHHLYIQSTCGPEIVVRRNVFTRAASHGAQLRTGGVFENNLLVGNAVGALVIRQGRVSGNVFLMGEQIAEGEAGAWGLDAPMRDPSVVEHNLFAHARADRAAPAAIRFTGPVTLRENVVFNWPVALRLSAGDYRNARVERNRFIQLAPTDLPLIVLDDQTPGPAWRDNQYATAPGQTLAGMTFAQWQQRIDTTATPATPLPHPTLRVDDAWLTAARHGQHDLGAMLTALRAAYGMSQPAPDPEPEPEPEPQTNPEADQRLNRIESRLNAIEQSLSAASAALVPVAE